MNITIKDIQVIETAPEGINLQVVKLETSEPGLYGLGCSTFAYRPGAVRKVIEDYLKPLILGLNVDKVKEIWHLMFNNSYWRNGPIENCAIAGIDMALWDIKGKIANLPLYSLLGGKVREAVPVYRHANGNTMDELLAAVDRLRNHGVKVIRCQLQGYGGEFGPAPKTAPLNSPAGVYLDGEEYISRTLKMFERLHTQFGRSVQFVHDTHERLDPAQALTFAKEMEPFNLFYLEDVLPAEQLGWYRLLRQQCATPLATGELFNRVSDWKTLVEQHLIDYVRVHISQIGGITPALELISYANLNGVKIAWHGPGDLSPVGHAANIQLDLIANNLGIQEWSGTEPPNFIIQELRKGKDGLLEVFHGLPRYKDGYVYANDRPGLGIDIDINKAKDYPCTDETTKWTQTRRWDGTIQAP